MSNFFIVFKSMIFGLVVSIWGLYLLLSLEVGQELTLELLFIAFSQPGLAILFIILGAMHMASQFINTPFIKAFSNILLAFAFILVTLTNLFTSVHMLAWIALAGIAIYQIINAFLIMKGYL